MRRYIGGLLTRNRDHLSGSYGFMGNEKWHLAKSLTDVTGICLVVDDKQWIVYYRGTCVISATNGFRETAFRLSRGPAVIVREYPCVSRACVSNANNHDQPFSIIRKINSARRRIRRRRAEGKYRLIPPLRPRGRMKEGRRERVTGSEKEERKLCSPRTNFANRREDSPFCCWFRGNESRRLCRPHPHFETWRSQNLKHRKNGSRLIIGNERCLVMWYETKYDGTMERCN